MSVDDKGAKQDQAAKYKTISPLAAYRMYNAAVATLVFFRYLTDPDASSTEYVPDIFIHLFEVVAPNSFPELAIAANSLRAAQTAYGFFEPSKSKVPQALNLVDTFNHIGNIGFRLF